MNKSESIAELAAALAKAQGAMTAAKMDSVNPFLKNKYADLGSVIQASKKPMSDNGLSYSQHPSIGDGSVSITTVLMHSSGQWLESTITLPFEISKGLSLAQAMGGVITYLRRYSLAAIFGLYADEDVDGNDNRPAAKQTPAAPKQQLVPPEPPMAMSLDEANTVVTSDGKPYHEIDVATLNNMANSIQRKLTSGGYTGDDKAIAERKLAAILVILANR